MRPASGGDARRGQSVLHVELMAQCLLLGLVTSHLRPFRFHSSRAPLVSEGRRNGRYVAKATTNSTSDWFHPLAYLQSNLLHDLRQVTEPPPTPLSLSLCLSIISYKEENNNPARGSSETQKMRWRLYKVPQRAESAPNIEDVRQQQP